MKIAALMTTYNRWNDTHQSLRSLDENCGKDSRVYCHVYLLDDSGDNIDRSKDFDYLANITVKVLKSKGDMYWSRGMRYLWLKALCSDNYDSFLWLNNDTFLLKNAFSKIKNCVLNGAQVVVGLCKDSEGRLTYGLRNDNYEILEANASNKWRVFNGNIVFIKKEVIIKVGLISDAFLHSLGDYDYAFRCKAIGIDVVQTNEAIGVCESNSNIKAWYSPKLSFSDRYRLFKSPKGLDYKRYILFLLRHDLLSFKSLLKLWLRLLFPSVFNFMRRTV